MAVLVDEAREIFEYVLGQFITAQAGQPLVLGREHVSPFTTALLAALESVGWFLQYDPAVLEATIKAAREEQPPLPEGLPVRLPEELVEP